MPPVFLLPFLLQPLPWLAASHAQPQLSSPPFPSFLKTSFLKHSLSRLRAPSLPSSLVERGTAEPLIDADLAKVI